MRDFYELMEYREAGHWVLYFQGYKLWECEYQASRLEMPWKILCNGKLLKRGDGQASVVSV